MAMPWRSPGVLRREPPGVHTAVMTTGPGEVVLDTNVFVAAGFNPGSHSARLVEAVRDGRLSIVWDDATHTEIEHVMRRSRDCHGLVSRTCFAPRTGSAV